VATHISNLNEFFILGIGYLFDFDHQECPMRAAQVINNEKKQVDLEIKRISKYKKQTKASL